MLKLFRNAKQLEDIIGKTDFDFQKPEVAQKYFNDEQMILKTGIPILDDIQHEVFESGIDQWVSISKFPLVDTEGKIIGTFGISKNIADLNKLNLEKQH